MHLTNFGTENIIFSNLIDIIGSFMHSIHSRPTLADDQVFIILYYKYINKD